MPPIVVPCCFLRGEVSPTSLLVDDESSSFELHYGNKSVTSKEIAFEVTQSRVDYLWEAFNEGSTSFINHETLFVLLQINTAQRDFPKDWVDAVVRGLIITDFPKLAVESYLKHVCSVDTTVDDETYRWVDNFFGVLINYSDISDAFRIGLAEAGAIDQLIECLSNSEEVMIDAMINKRKAALLDYKLVLLYNLSCGFNMMSRFETCGGPKILEAYFKCKHSDYVRVVAAMCGARINTDWPHAIDLWSGDGKSILHLLFAYFAQAALNERHRHRGISCHEVAEALRLLAITDKDKEILVNMGILQRVGTLLKSEVEAEQLEGIAILFSTCSNKTSCSSCFTVINNDEDCMKPLKLLVEYSKSETVKEDANRFLDYVYKRANSQQTKDAKPRPTIYLSFHESDWSAVKKIERLFIGNGLKVVNSLLLTSGSGYQKVSSEESLSNADAVAICFSEAYYLSEQCRCESELAVSLKKSIVSVQIVPKYQQEGWLLELLQAHSIVQIEGEESMLQTESTKQLLQQLTCKLAENA